MKNPYKKDSTLLANPADFLYQKSDTGISPDDAIQELISYAIDLDDQIEGDFDLDYLVFKIRSNTLPGVNYSLMRGENFVRGELTRTVNHYDLFWGLRAFV